MEQGRLGFGSRWQRVWWMCILMGACLGFGGGALRAVTVFAVFRPLTVELDTALPPEARLQTYRIAALQTPYVWGGTGLFLVGMAALVWSHRRRLRAHGWLFMASVLTLLAAVGELWLALAYDVSLLRLVALEVPPVAQLDSLVVQRVRTAGAVATLTALAEWTVVLLCIWQPLERRQQ